MPSSPRSQVASESAAMLWMREKVGVGCDDSDSRIVSVSGDEGGVMRSAERCAEETAVALGFGSDVEGALRKTVSSTSFLQKHTTASSMGPARAPGTEGQCCGCESKSNATTLESSAC